MPAAERFAALFTGTLLAVSFGGSVEAQPPAVTSDASVAASSVIAADLYQFPPVSPEELLEAARVTSKLDRPGDAKAFLRQILNSQLGENELRLLREQVGPAPFLELRQDARLRPESVELLAAVNAASRTKTWSTAELQDFVQKLAVPGSVGTNAASELNASGEAALPALLAADPATSAGQVADQLLRSQASSFRSGLIRQMTDASPELQVRLIRLLQSTGQPDVAIRLLRWQFDPAVNPSVSDAAREALAVLTESQPVISSRAEAADFLVQNATTRLQESGARFSTLDEPDAVKQVAVRNLRLATLNDARATLADAVVIDPISERALTVSLVAESATADASLTTEPTVAAGKSSAELLNGLAVALGLHPVAAIELLKGLQAVSAADTDLVETGRVLGKALLHPDARVRLLAAVRSEKLPVEVSRASVARCLSSVRNGSLKPEIVIVSPDVDQLRTLQLVFQDAGFEPQIASTGPEGFEIAAVQMTCELFILDAESPLWPFATTIANLRADVRTRNTPIVVIGQERFHARVLALSKIHQGVWFIPEPAGSLSLLQKLSLKNLPANVLTAEDRATMKKLAE